VWRGVVLVDRAGCAVLVNRAAQSILSSNDGLTLRAQHLNAASLSQTTALRALVAGVIAVSLGDGAASGGAIPIGRPSGKRALQVLVTALWTTRTDLQLPSTACAAVFVSDPDVQPLTDALALRQFFGFTRAETQLAVQLLQHRSVEEAAEALDISVNTARTHVRLFEKTNTRRQSEPYPLRSARASRGS
jgi:DNA-binding CsgD family transcriptional regulator